MTSASHPYPGHVLVPLVPPKKWEVWVGRVLSAIPVLMMGFSGVMKLTHAPPMVEVWVNKFGWPERYLTPVAVAEIACAVLFAVPKTATLGAILLAAYLGAAFATHLRIHDAGNGVIPIVLAVLAWVGLYLRDERVRSLLPLRTFGRESASAAA